MFKTWGISIFVIFISLFVCSKIPVQNSITPQEYFDSNDTNAIYLGEKIIVPKYLADLSPKPKQVLGDTNTDKKIYVDLSSQMLYAYQGEKLIYSFLISSGKWGRTPTGVFDIWSKFRYTKMSGGSVALHTYYYLPNVPYVMFFSNNEVAASKGFSLHGTYWHNNFGTPMSHGCINMKTSEAALIYEWADPQIPTGKNSVRSSPKNLGTQVIIYGKPPSS